MSASRFEQGGSKASINGKEIEDLIKMQLTLAKIREDAHATSIAGLINSVGSPWLYDDEAIGSFAKQLPVELDGPANAGKNRKARVDFVLVNLFREPVLLSVKSQKSDGSAEQKLWFEIQKLIDTGIPAAVFVHGDIKGPRSSGWGAEFLETIWDWTMYRGKQVFLFRSQDRLIRWLKDGFPVAGKGVTFDALFNKYCDKNP